VDLEFPYVGRFVNTLTLAQVRTLDCGTRTLPNYPEQVPAPGSRMPLLREVFDLVTRYRADAVRLNVETKVEAGAPAETAPREQFVQVVAAEIRDAGFLRRVTIQSFDWGALMRMRQVEPRLPLVALTNRDFLQTGQPGAGAVARRAVGGPAGRLGGGGVAAARPCRALAGSPRVALAAPREGHIDPAGRWSRLGGSTRWLRWCGARGGAPLAPL
jgi:glycerophosphoryl diester phosphodiesterase